jgi:hypothetical protein
MDIDKTLNDAAADKIRDYRADDSLLHFAAYAAFPSADNHVLASFSVAISRCYVFHLDTLRFLLHY